MVSAWNHLLLTGLSDFFIADEPGTTIVGTGVGTLLRVENCHNITFKNLALDYDPLPFTQGVITEVYADECAVDWRLDSGFAPLTAEPFASKKDGFGGKILDIETGRVLSHHGLEIVSFVELGNGLFRLEGDPAQYDNGLDEKLIKVGTPLAVHTRGIEGRPPAVWVASCKHIDLYNINLYASYAHSYLLNDNEAIKLFNCSVQPRPGTNRLTVSNADGFHCRSNRQGPYFSGCKAWRNCDDTSNLYSRAVSVDHILDDTHFVLDARFRPEDKTREWQPDIRAFREGDLLAFIDPNTGNMDGLVTIRKMSDYDWHGHRMLMVEVSESLPSIKSQEDLGKPFPVPKNFEYLYKEDPSEVFEHFVVNLSTKSDGFVMRDCTFGENSVNGTKLKASHGIIENCEFLRHAGEAITFCMRLTWQEAFAARYIDVCNNLFDSHAGIDSTIDYPGPGRFHYGPSYMTGIRVTGNTFKGMEQGSFGLSLHNLRDSEFSDNEFSGSLTIFDDCQRLQFRGNTHNGEPLAAPDITPLF